MKDQTNQISTVPTKKTISRDEMNLAEFPLTVLSTRSNPNAKTLEFQDTLFDQNKHPIHRKWVITGADKFGLPTASDDEVLLGLMKLTVDDTFNDRKVFFTRYELLKTLRWTTEGRSYTRLQNALDRLSGVRIKATNAFYDNESKAYSTKNFGIIDSYEINDGRGAGIKPSFFIWSEEIFKSFQVGFIKKLDLDFYLDLQSAVSKRLYRYLDKHFWYKSMIRSNLFTLAHEKIGVSRNYKYASLIRQQLDPAIEELINCGFLSHCEYEGKGKNTEVVLYSAKGARRTLGQDRESASEKDSTLDLNTYSESVAENGVNCGVSIDELVEKLVRRGLKTRQAETLLSKKSAEDRDHIGKIIDYFDKLVSEQSRLVSKSPVGFLYKAIENSDIFVLPSDEKTKKKIIENKKKKQAKLAADNLAARRLLEKKYQENRTAELRRIKKEIEPTILNNIKETIESSLARIKGMISDKHFSEAVEHGVEQKLAETFAFPSFEEWLAEQK